MFGRTVAWRFLAPPRVENIHPFQELGTLQHDRFAAAMRWHSKQLALAYFRLSAICPACRSARACPVSLQRFHQRRGRPSEHVEGARLNPTWGMLSTMFSRLAIIMVARWTAAICAASMASISSGGSTARMTLIAKFEAPS